MADDSSIVIKKIKKGGHGGAHGGAWKVAYADFVTAMMAFFLLLWLLTASTQEQLEGLSNYFAPTSISQGTSGADGLLGGKIIAEQGASTADSARISPITADLPPPRAGAGGDGVVSKTSGIQKLEMEVTAAQIKLELQKDPNIADLAEHLLIDVIPEGLRIQVIDQQGRSLFKPGSAEMFPYTRRILRIVSRFLLDAPQDIAIIGHTDKTSSKRKNYTNWELSADRAHATRRVLNGFKIVEPRIARITGKAAREPLFADKPNDPRNRRIEIILLKGTKGNNPYARYDPINEALPGLNNIRQQQIKEEMTKPKARP